MDSNAYTILLVDDNDDLREVTSELLETLGHRVHTATRAEAALRVFDDHRGEIDVLVTEVLFAGMTGLELIDRLRRRKPSLGVLLVSTHDNHPHLHEKVERGEVVFLRKPYSSPELAAEIEHAMKARAPISRDAGEPQVSPTRRDEPERRRRSTPWRPILAGALVFGAVAAIGFFVSRAPGLPDRVPVSVLRGTVAEPIYPVGTIPGLPEELRWRPVDKAVRYGLQLVRVDDSILWQTTVTGSRATLPPEIRTRLRPRVVYLWSLQAYDVQGRRLAGAERIRFITEAAATDRETPFSPG